MTKKLKKSKKSLESLLSEHAALILDSLKNNNVSNNVQESIHIPTAKIQVPKDHNLTILDSFMKNRVRVNNMKLEEDISQYSERLQAKIFELCELYVASITLEKSKDEIN